MKMKLFILALASMLALAACGGEDTEETATEEEETNDTESVEEEDTDSSEDAD